MYRARLNTFCVNCGAPKRKFKCCIKNHHSLVFEDDDEVFENRYLKPVKTEIVKSPLLPTYNCPIHDKTAIGYCFDCDRYICNLNHFDHNMFLFRDYGISNDVDFDIYNDDYYNALEDAIDEMIKIFNERQSIIDDNMKIRDMIIRTVAPFLATGSSTLNDYIMQVLIMFYEFKADDIHDDIDLIPWEIEKLQKELYKFTYSESVLGVINAIRFPKPLPEKYQQWNKDHRRCKPVFITPTYITIRYRMYEIYDYSFHVTESSDYKCFRIGNKLISLSEFVKVTDLETYTTDVSKHRYVEFFNFNKKLSFIDTKNRINILDIDTMNTIVLEKQLRPIKTMNTDIEVMGLDENNIIWYWDGEWKQFKLQIPFDTIEFYIGSSYTNKVKYGAIASQSMIYRLRQPSFRIRKVGEIDLLYDGQLIMYSDGFEALDYVI